MPARVKWIVRDMPHHPDSAPELNPENAADSDGIFSATELPTLPDLPLARVIEFVPEARDSQRFAVVDAGAEGRPTLAKCRSLAAAETMVTKAGAR